MVDKREKRRRAELLRGSPWDREKAARDTPVRFDAEVARAQIASAVGRCTFGDGVSKKSIESAEARLGIRLPPSYRWWLENYGGGTIGGYELVGLWDEFEEEERRHPEDAAPGILLYSVELDRKSGRRPHHEIELLSIEGDEVYMLDLSQESGGENPILLEEPAGLREMYAHDFYEFIWKILR